MIHDHQSALLSVARTLNHAELFHPAIVVRVAKGHLVQRPELTGKDQHGQPLREGHRHAPPLGSSVWISATPFVAPRFIKSRGNNTLHGQINAELASRNLPLVERIDVLQRSTNAISFE